MHRICEASLDPLIEEKLACLSERMEHTRSEVVGKVETMFKKLDLIRTDETEIANEMELLKQGILFNSTKIERAKQVIAKKQTILARLEPEQKVDTTKLETLVKKSESLQEIESELTWELQEAQAQLKKLDEVAARELREQYIIEAEEARRAEIASLEAILKMYARGNSINHFCKINEILA